jgi:pyruvate formate lyase activating enzyme
MKNDSIACGTCFRHCVLNDGQTGYCRARWNKNGIITDRNYGQLTALALDPIEKKPLAMFFPGSLILSEGSYGCNLRCPFCQNSEISQADSSCKTEYVSPAQLADKAAELRPQVISVLPTHITNRLSAGNMYVTHQSLSKNAA